MLTLCVLGVFLVAGFSSYIKCFLGFRELLKCLLCELFDVLKYETDQILKVDITNYEHV